jgi:hypothetical protein
MLGGPHAEALDSLCRARFSGPALCGPGGCMWLERSIARAEGRLPVRRSGPASGGGRDRRGRRRVGKRRGRRFDQVQHEWRLPARPALLLSGERGMRSAGAVPRFSGHARLSDHPALLVRGDTLRSLLANWLRGGGRSLGDVPRRERLGLTELHHGATTSGCFFSFSWFTTRVAPPRRRCREDGERGQGTRESIVPGRLDLAPRVERPG